MPPEQAVGGVRDLAPQADVFALGAIMMEILTGRPPYWEPGISATEMLRRAAHWDIDNAMRRLDAAGCHDDLATLTRACLARRIDDRPADAGEVADRISEHFDAADRQRREKQIESAALRGRLLEEANTRRAIRQRQRWGWIAMLATSLLILGIAAATVIVSNSKIAQAKARQTADEHRTRRQIETADRRRAIRTRLEQSIERSRQQIGEMSGETVPSSVAVEVADGLLGSIETHRSIALLPADERRRIGDLRSSLNQLTRWTRHVESLDAIWSDSNRRDITSIADSQLRDRYHQLHRKLWQTVTIDEAMRQFHRRCDAMPKWAQREIVAGIWRWRTADRRATLAGDQPVTANRINDGLGVDGDTDIDAAATPSDEGLWRAVVRDDVDAIADWCYQNRSTAFDDSKSGRPDNPPIDPLVNLPTPLLLSMAKCVIDAGADSARRAADSITWQRVTPIKAYGDSVTPNRSGDRNPGDWRLGDWVRMDPFSRPGGRPGYCSFTGRLATPVRSPRLMIRIETTLATMPPATLRRLVRIGGEGPPIPGVFVDGFSVKWRVDGGRVDASPIVAAVTTYPPWPGEHVGHAFDHVEDSPDHSLVISRLGSVANWAVRPTPWRLVPRNPPINSGDFSDDSGIGQTVLVVRNAAAGSPATEVEFSFQFDDMVRRSGHGIDAVRLWVSDDPVPPSIDAAPILHLILREVATRGHDRQRVAVKLASLYRRTCPMHQTEALTAASAALAMRPGDPMGVRTLADVVVDRSPRVTDDWFGRLRTALASMEKSVEASAVRRDIGQRLCHLAAEKSDSDADGAIELLYFAKALMGPAFDHDPMLAKWLLWRSRHRDAESVWLDGVTNHPDSARHQRGLAQWWFRNHQYADAAAQMRRCLRCPDATNDDRCFAAKTHLFAKQPDRAVEFLRTLDRRDALTISALATGLTLGLDDRPSGWRWMAGRIARMDATAKDFETDPMTNPAVVDIAMAILHSDHQHAFDEFLHRHADDLARFEDAMLATFDAVIMRRRFVKPSHLYDDTCMARAMTRWLDTSHPSVRVRMALFAMRRGDVASAKAMINPADPTFDSTRFDRSIDDAVMIETIGYLIDTPPDQWASISPGALPTQHWSKIRPATRQWCEWVWWEYRLGVHRESVWTPRSDGRPRSGVRRDSCSVRRDSRGV